MAKNLIIALLTAALAAVALWSSPEMVTAGNPDAPVRQAAAPGPQAPAAILQALREIENDPALASAAFGFCLLDPEGETIAVHQERLPLIPASTLKTLTVASALEILGPEFHFETVVEATGRPGDPHLESLVIRGGGDPTLAMPTLEKWADELAARGVKSIGQVLGDASIFTAPTVGDFWGWGDIGNAYGSPAAGLNLNHNRFLARFIPGNPGQAARFAGAEPEVPAVRWENTVTTAGPGSGDGVVIYAGPAAAVIRLTGTVPAGVDRFEVGGAVPDPAHFTAFHLDRLLRERGITIHRAPAAGSARESRRWLSHRSAKLLEIARQLQQTSDNHEAECLFRMIGVHQSDDPASVIRRHWETRGLPLAACRLVDGSGLSRANYLPAITLARLQHLALTGPAGRDYLSTLNPTRQGDARTKGGAMSAVRSSTGCLTLADGRQGSFAILFNHFPDSTVVEKHISALTHAIMK